MVDIQLTPLLLPYLLSVIVTLGLTGYGIKTYLSGKAATETALAFVGITASVSVWTIARMFELLFVGETFTRFWLSTLYVGYGGATMSALFFGIAFTGRRRLLTSYTAGALLVIPAAAVGVAATNPVHELFWVGEFVERSDWYGDLLVFDREFQPLFYAYLVYTVGCTLIGLGLLVRRAVGSASVYRRQSIAFVGGAAVALLTGVLFALGRQPFVPAFVDLSPIGFAVMGVAFGYGIYRHQLLDVVPVGRDTVIEGMRDGYVVLDTENRVVDLNNAAREMFDLGEESIGTPIDEALPACADVVERHDHGTRTETEIEIADRQRFLVASVSSLTEGESRIGRLILLQDITGQRTVKRRYRALIENSSDLIFVVTPEKEIEYASPSVRRIAGVGPEEIIGTNAFELVHGEDREPFEAEFEELLDDPGGKFRTEYRSRDADGNIIHLEASVRNLLENPFVEGVVVNAREITERKERERELREANARLTRANEQLERFASVISHDLRNPLNVAHGHLDLARQTGDDHHFEKVQTSLDRMETIIEDVLTLAREGRSIGETEPVNLKDNARLAWGNVDTADARLVVTDNATFEADRDRLLQLFENLFRNAIEHGASDVDVDQDVLKRGSTSAETQSGDASTEAPEGAETPETAGVADEPSVTVTVGFDDALYIEDDGPGIPEDERDEVLEPGHTTSDEGTGLGLSIVEQIANAHGWETRVTEGTDGGARFEFVGVERVS